MNYYTKIPNDLLDFIYLNKLSATEIKILLYFARNIYGYRNKKSHKKKIESIAEKIKKDKSGTYHGIARLIKRGILAKIKEGRPSEYIFCLENSTLDTKVDNMEKTPHNNSTNMEKTPHKHCGENTTLVSRKLHTNVEKTPHTSRRKHNSTSIYYKEKKENLKENPKEKRARARGGNKNFEKKKSPKEGEHIFPKDVDRKWGTMFEDFYQAYPLVGNRYSALAAWIKLKPATETECESTLSTIIASLEANKEYILQHRLSAYGWLTKKIWEEKKVCV